MRYCILFFLLFLCFLFPIGKIYSEPLKISVDSESSILINAETGFVLFEKDADRCHYPASTTKIATALYALKKKRACLEDKITASQEAIGSISSSAKRQARYAFPAYWLEQGSSHIGIKKGEILSFNDLLHGMMLASGNDAANVIAQYVSGEVPQFMEELNVYLKEEVGCRKTVLYNPHGLHHPEHRTTARDLSLIAKEAMKDLVFSSLVSTERYVRPKTNKQESTVFVQTNQLIRKGSSHYYPKAIGVKTGYTSEAKYSLVAAARDGERTLIAVVLKCPDRDLTFGSVKKMFNAAFAQSKVRYSFFKKGPQKFKTAIEGGRNLLETYLDEDFIISCYPAEEPSIKGSIMWKSLKAPVKRGEHVATIKLSSEGNIFNKNISLFAAKDVPSTFRFSLILFWENSYKWLFGLLIFFILLSLFFLFRRVTGRGF